MSGKQISRPSQFSRCWKTGSLCIAVALSTLIIQGSTDSEAAPRRKVKKKPAVKKEEPLPPRFMVKSKSVSTTKLSSALKSAEKIDKLVEANYSKYKVKPNPMTTDEQFLRRIYLDITGTIPTYRETRYFLASRHPDKRKNLIDRLLNSDGYASHSFNYWADVLRYTDRLNNNVDGTAYRQWIKQSLAENKPWDKMVQEMISAEGLIWENPATGYLQRDSGMPLDNMNNTVRIFLGTRIGCAQCHDHPFDRWKQKEFYQMAAFTFGSLTRANGRDKRFYTGKDPNGRLRKEYKELDQEEEDRRRNQGRFNRMIRVNMMVVNDQIKRKIQLPHDYAYTDAKPKSVVQPKTIFGKPADIKPGEAPRKAFARWMVSKDNPRFALTIANRLWKQAFGRGQIEPVDDMMDSTVAENPELMKYLESEMKRLNFDMKEYLRIIYNSKTYQRQASTKDVPLSEFYHFPGPVLRRMTAEQAWDSFLTLAVVDPEEYRELPSKMKSEIIAVDLNTATAQEVLEADNKKREEIDRKRYKREKKYRYKGQLLARASELPSPVPAGHFLRTFGQSNRELISASSDSGSVPQILFMFNGPVTHMMLEKGSTIYNNVIEQKKVKDGVDVIFMTILNRKPDKDESQIAMSEIEKNGPAGYGNVIWSLVNTREFLFIQ
ncbi:MAG: DUF1549 and DUF1553 domain-containing protein [Planctomycetes bacterium]|nr:DUF1549 and DUF1553 domain-containing protein [Planctomycetota bacterium]MCH9723389.1 DUF1549 and DUF1553 domain-containing protein [Planctomycetota bacterium]MCH9779036.1 DUF1549 and DUF1553 domain-containing protein [Planctomycetota bacterium]